ncbi:hypothetical protein DRP77_01995 [Candidatus Poribacteria bacterium]|nr:MAG: hypothetical protein DRP77_01995 [Candidatus Poribacteria bacterium]
MKLSYDPRYNIAYIRFKEEVVEGVRSIQVSDAVIVDIAPDGTIYGIELLNASEILGRDAKLTAVNEETGEQVECPLPSFSSSSRK